jgi:hypothetical protein
MGGHVGGEGREIYLKKKSMDRRQQTNTAK